jgi:uncharacterized protein YdeI (YjbR/CyaY-like superfamily)
MAELKDSTETFYAKSRKEWRKWLEKNHASKKVVRLIIFKKQSSVPTVSYLEAVEEALCFGWIDAKANKKDDESYYQSFSRRNPKSNWSKINKLRVTELVKENLMTEAGLEAIKAARENGAWDASKKVDNETIPEDLKLSFSKNKTALRNFNGFSPSSRKIILGWIQSAKRPETRLKRIETTVMLAAKNVRANH